MIHRNSLYSYTPKDILIQPETQDGIYICHGFPPFITVIYPPAFGSAWKG
jgi:hypothetical protein